MLHKGNFIKRLIKKHGFQQNLLTDKSNDHYVGFGKNTLIDLLKNSDFEKEVDKERARVVLTIIGADQEDFEFVFPEKSNSNANDLGPLSIGDADTPMKEVSPGFYLLTAELVPVHAQAGYLLGYQDQEYIEALPKYTSTVNKYVKGKYRYFETVGESMNNGSIDEAIPDGTILLCREIGKELWTSKLNIHSSPNFVFVHRTEGIVVKQIAHQDYSNGLITLRSLNTDKGKYPYFEVQMDDLLEIYNVMKRII